jgi:hypothetical protein
VLAQAQHFTQVAPDLGRVNVHCADEPHRPSLMEQAGATNADWPQSVLNDCNGVQNLFPPMAKM